MMLLALWLAPLCARAETPVTRGAALNWLRLPDADGCIAAVELANRVEQRLLTVCSAVSARATTGQIIRAIGDRLMNAP